MRRFLLTVLAHSKEWVVAYGLWSRMGIRTGLRFPRSPETDHALN
ncbi:MAG: hypothetical protein WD425_12585 [Nitrospirales bacterium]